MPGTVFDVLVALTKTTPWMKNVHLLINLYLCANSPLIKSFSDTKKLKVLTYMPPYKFYTHLKLRDI